MLKGIIVAISGMVSAALTYIIAGICCGGVYPMLVQYLPVPPSSPLYVCYQYFNYIVILILAGPIIGGTMSLVYLALRPINREQEQYNSYQ